MKVYCLSVEGTTRCLNTVHQSFTTKCCSNLLFDHWLLLTIFRSNNTSLITVRKRSLAQGNVFTSVCQSFCSRGVEVSVRGSLCPGGVCPGVSVQVGSLSRGVVSVQGGLCRGDISVQGDSPRTVKSGRNASYWNAFLLWLWTQHVHS